MARKQNTPTRAEWKAALVEMVKQDDSLRQMVELMVQEVLEAEMDEALGASKSERTPNRRGYRSGHYSRSLITRVGKIELRVPQDRQGHFRTEVFERYQRSEKALVGALAEMYVQGVSTRKVKVITEELCGHEFSAAAVSRVNASLDEELTKFAERRLEEEYPYLVLDARYERVREDGVVRKQAVQVAIGINREGRRCVLAVELAHRESTSSWREFLLQLQGRGLRGVQLVVSDDHAGLKQAIAEVLTGAAWQRCYVHFLRNALDYLPRKASDDCLVELRWLYDRHDVQQARQDLGVWLTKWQAKYQKLCDWVEANIEETFTFYQLPVEHHKHLKSTNLIERVNEEIKRRTLVVRIFPNAASCLRLVRALAVEMHEEWIEGTRYLNMDLWEEHERERRRQRLGAAGAAAAAD
jgi:transposase-like protein